MRVVDRQDVPAAAADVLVGLDQAAVVGLVLDPAGGRVHERQIERAREIFARAVPAVTKILVTHHPFEARLLACGADLLLSGHLHRTKIGHMADRQRIGARTVLIVQAGTATSSRTREEPNSFNFLQVQGRELRIAQYALRGGAFERAGERRFNI